MTVFTLKIIAVISMILDHIKYAIPATDCAITEYLGRIAFPIFAFLISEGFVHTRSKPRYMMRMLIFAIISQVPFHLLAHNLAHSQATLNVMFTFEYALIGLYILDFFKNYDGFPKFLNYAFIIASLSMILFIVYFVHPDYSWYGVSLVWIFYLLRKSKILTTFGFIIIVVIYYLSKGISITIYYPLILFSILPIIFILLYNGEKGKSLKYFFYAFYPLHMLLLYAINYFFI